jgi:hypothetical protein
MDRAVVRFGLDFLGLGLTVVVVIFIFNPFVESILLIFILKRPLCFRMESGVITFVSAIARNACGRRSIGSSTKGVVKSRCGGSSMREVGSIPESD